MMEVDFLPRHLLIVGGSYVGLEFAQMFRRFGSEVTVVEKDSRLISRRTKMYQMRFAKFCRARASKFV